MATSLLLLLYKGYTLKYVPGNLEVEFVFLFLYAGIDSVRLYMLSKGNKLEDSGSLVQALILSTAVILLNIYYLAMQMYMWVTILRDHACVALTPLFCHASLLPTLRTDSKNTDPGNEQHAP